MASFPLLDPAEEQSGFEMRNTPALVQVAGHDPWIGGRGCAPECSRVQPYCCEIIFCHLQPPPPPPEKIVPARSSSVSPGRLIVGVRKGVKWAAGGLGGYFWAAPGDISGCGLERNGSEADNWGG